MVKTSVAKLMLDWDVMIANVDKDEALRKPAIQELRQELLEIQQRLKALLNEQNQLEGLRKRVTQQVQEHKDLGSDVAIKLRGAIRSHYGHRDEGLSRFRMRPIRQRPRRKRREGEADGSPPASGPGIPGAGPDGQT